MDFRKSKSTPHETSEPAVYENRFDEPNRIRKLTGEPPSKKAKRKRTPDSGSSSFQAETPTPIRLEEIKQEDTTENNFISQMDNPFKNYGLITSKWMKNDEPTEEHHLPITSRDMDEYPYLRLPYSDLLPSTEHLQVWARNRSLVQFACDLMKLLFTKDERIVCNVNGKMGKLQFNPHKINLIKEVLQFYARIPESAFEEQWKVCVTKIDTANRGLKRRYKCKDIFSYDNRS